MAKIEMFLFKKQMTIKEGEKKGQSFDKYFMKFPKADVFIATNLTNECKAKLLLSGCQFPMKITLELTDDIYGEDGVTVVERGNKDYFITAETYKNQFGEDTLKDVCVVQDFRSVEHLEMSTKSLEDYLIEMTKGVDTKTE